MPIDQEELAIMTARLSGKIKFHQGELQKLQMIGQRINMLNQSEPKDQFGEKYSQADLEKHYAKAKAEFEKVIPSKKV